MNNPFGHELGLAISMGTNLKSEVEGQLLIDLNYYHKFNDELHFDWSESCIEGKSLRYMDGLLENFSGIAIYNAESNLIADGWMDFIYINEQNQLIVYWDFLDIYLGEKKVEVKTKTGLPNHINKRLKEKES